MLKYVLGFIVAFSTIAIVDAPQAEARFGSRYASASGWRPGKLLLKIRHANADRRANRRAEGRGLFPGRMTGHASCGTAQVLESCPSCPTTTTTTKTTTKVQDCPSCPTGVCPKN
jgi:hypothetical protein